MRNQIKGPNGSSFGIINSVLFFFLGFSVLQSCIHDESFSLIQIPIIL